MIDTGSNAFASLQRDSTKTVNFPVPLTVGMVYLWEIDTSIRAQFDIDTEWGACLYCVYIWLHKDRYPGLTLPPGMDQSIYLHTAIDFEQTGISLTRFMLAVLSLDPHLASAFPLHASDGRLGYWAWFLTNFPELRERPQYFSLLAAPTLSIPLPPGCATLPLALLVEHHHNVELSQFDYHSPEGSWSLAQWWLSGGGLEISLLATVAKDWARRWRENLAVGSMREVALACQMALWCAGQESFAHLAATEEAQIFLHTINAVAGDVPITRCMQTLLLVRHDLKAQFDTDSPESMLQFWGYLIQERQEFYAHDAFLKHVYKPIGLGSINNAPALPLGLAALWSVRQDLQHFAINRSAKDRWALVDWWLSGNGLTVPFLVQIAADWARRWRENLAVGSMREVALACQMALWCAGQESFAHLAATEETQIFLHTVNAVAGDVPITRCMQTLLLVRNDLKAQFDTDSPTGMLHFWGWLLLERQELCDHAAFMELASQPIHPPFTTGKLTLPLGLCALWYAKQDLHCFDIATETGVKALVQWWRTHGIADNPFLQLLANRLDLGQACTAGRQHQGGVTRHFIGQRQSGGVNVIGFAKGEFGIGEDARMTTRACQEAGIPVCVLDVPYEIPSRRNDQRLAGLLAAEPQFAVNIFCMPIFEVLRMYFLYGEELFRGRLNIGICPWELPSWPSELAGALRLLDTLWTPSAYIAAAYAPWTTRPVVHVPLAVEAATIAAYPRVHYGIPDDAFVFLFICDGASWNPRKNPLGVVNAFRLAFPDAQAEKVRLVIKTMNNQPDAPDFRALQAQVALDIGLILINETLSYETLLGLHACSDAYISLHRAEGFGRTMAEAMLLNKPVIASSFSGNLDFCNNETSFLVDGHTVPVNKDGYIFYKDQHWFEPDINSAAALMRQVRLQPNETARRASNGKDFIERHHSPAAVGRLYIERLRQLGVLA